MTGYDASALARPAEAGASSALVGVPVATVADSSTSAGAAGPLVLYTEIAATKEDEGAVLARLERFKLLALAREVLQDRRVKWCLKRRISNKRDIDIYKNEELGTFRCGNLARCGMSQVCPFCALADGEKVRAELDQAVKWGREHGYQILFTTFTISHGRGDDLGDMLDAIGKAYRRMTSTRAYKDLCRAYGVAHVVRSLEATVGGWHGWHPHFHALQFGRPGADWHAFQVALASLWIAALAEYGFEADAKRGVWVETAADKVADYIAKWGKLPKRRIWEAHDELAKSHSKRGGGDRSLTPFDLLRKIAELRGELAGLSGGEARNVRYHLEKYEGWFREYDQAVFRRHRVQYTPGLRSAAGLPCEELDKRQRDQAERDRSDRVAALSFEEWLDDEVYNAQLAQEDKPVSAEVWLVDVAFADWLVIDRQNLQGHLLEAARRGGADGVRSFVALVAEAQRSKGGVSGE